MSYPNNNNNKKIELELVKKKEQLKSDYRKVFSSVQGIRVLEDLAKRCFLKHTTFRENQDITGTVFNEGKRAVFLHVQTMMEKKGNVTS